MDKPNLHGVQVEAHRGRYRVIRAFPSGRFVHLGIFGSPAEAIQFATETILAIEPGEQSPS